MTTEIEILQYLHRHPLSKRVEIGSAVTAEMSDRTLKRILAACVEKKYIEAVGKGPATRYKLTSQAHVTMPLNPDTYFNKDVDERIVQERFNFDLIRKILPNVRLFTDDELSILYEAQSEFRQNRSEMTDIEYRKEMERLGIDLSWKSSQIEGNTYSLLDTERLLKERQTAKPGQITNRSTTRFKSGKRLRTVACLSTKRARCLKSHCWPLCFFHTSRLSPMGTSARHAS